MSGRNDPNVTKGVAKKDLTKEGFGSDVGGHAIFFCIQAAFHCMVGHPEETSKGSDWPQIKLLRSNYLRPLASKCHGALHNTGALRGNYM